jgi:acetoin utilization protein AcuB
MTADPITVGPDDTLAAALRLTREHRVRHLPVVLHERELTGIVSDRDIRLAMPSPLTVADAERADFLERTPVAAVMTREVITTLASDTIEAAAQALYRHRIGALPVVTATGCLEGLLSETDILRAFVQILGGMEPRSRIEIAIADRPGRLARAIQIIGEDLGLNIVSIVVPSLAAQSRKTAIVHLSTIDPRRAIDKLTEAGFSAGWPSLEAEHAG